jgi:hypothetical protein
MRRTEQNTETLIAKGTTHKRTKGHCNFNTHCSFYSKTNQMHIISILF